MSLHAASLPTEITPATLQAWLSDGKNVQILDVRSHGEFAAAHIARAMSVPLGQIPRFTWTPDGEYIIVCICQSGRRSAQARDQLKAMGWQTVTSLLDGMNGWTAAGFPLERDVTAPWDLERQVRFTAGSVVAVGAALGWLVHPGFYAVCAAMGAGLAVSGLTNWCGLGLLLARAPWNRPRT